MSKRINLSPSPKMLEIIEHVMQDKGIKQRTQAVEFLAITGYDKLYPAYVRAGVHNSPGTVTEQAVKSEEKAKARRKAKNESKAEEKRNICINQLGGTVDDSSGQPMCIYNVYDRQDVFPQEVPLDHVTEEMATRQYLPDRETVERLQNRG